MKRFTVRGADFFAPTTFSPHYPVEHRERCRVAMLQLIARYELVGRRVLSLGSGGAHEEYWLHRSSCPLTLVDIDEYHVLESYLASLPTGGELEYAIGDAMEFLGTASPSYDCLYLSSFTPDELWRGQRQDAHARRLWQRMRRRLGDETTWPRDGEPFGPYVVQGLRRALRPGGLFISQSYYRGVDLARNPHYLASVRRQMHTLGVEPLAYHTFAPPWTGVALVVAMKGSPGEARELTAYLARKPEIESFHGRSDVATGIVTHRFTP